MDVNMHDATATATANVSGDIDAIDDEDLLRQLVHVAFINNRLQFASFHFFSFVFASKSGKWNKISAKRDAFAHECTNCAKNASRNSTRVTM